MNCMRNTQSGLDGALADCAFWALRELAGQFKKPDVSPSEVIAQIIFTARALTAYGEQMNGNIPVGVLGDALRPFSRDQPLIASTEDLLISVAAVTANRDFGGSSDQKVNANLTNWVASAFARRKTI